MWELDHKERWAPKNWCFWTEVLGKTLESPLDCKETKLVNPKGNQSWIFIWKDWCWSWNSNTVAAWCKDLTHLKRPWCWERLKTGEERFNRGWDGWMTLPTQWTWIWASSRRWWRTRKPGVLQSMESQRVRHDWMTEQQQPDTQSQTSLAKLLPLFVSPDIRKAPWELSALEPFHLPHNQKLLNPEAIDKAENARLPTSLSHFTVSKWMSHILSLSPVNLISNLRFMKESESESRSVVSDPLQLHGLTVHGIL